MTLTFFFTLSEPTCLSLVKEATGTSAVLFSVTSTSTPLSPTRETPSGLEEVSSVTVYLPTLRLSTWAVSETPPLISMVAVPAGWPSSSAIWKV